MTDESRPVETQDIASPPTEDTQTEIQAPEKPVQKLPEDAEESAEEPAEPACEEEETLQAETVAFEEDAAPPARADEALEEEIIESETTQEPVGCAPDAATDTSTATTPQSEIQNPPPAAPTVESVIEAILFATDEPLTDSRLAAIVETTAKQVRQSIESLNTRYEANNSAFRIEQIAGGYQMLTLNTYNYWLKKMVHARSDTKLSPAALETLAIIAYKQPIIRADIEAVRGVAAGEVIRSLMYKGLVKIVGRAEILGRPMLYGTTKKFLEVFGLNSLKDLPKAEELKNPDR
ncbi:MAG: SMC-Scp complex subunit ScpB [Sedimentisphaerales bacterium]|nr:SMC-Scp complex subunit ScpB [Sedimentisphaerales bacterium]